MTRIIINNLHKDPDSFVRVFRGQECVCYKEQPFEKIHVMEVKGGCRLAFGGLSNYQLSSIKIDPSMSRLEIDPLKERAYPDTKETGEYFFAGDGKGAIWFNLDKHEFAPALKYTAQEFYCALMSAWKNNELAKYWFPLTAITDTQFDVNDGWTLKHPERLMNCKIWMGLGHVYEDNIHKVINKYAGRIIGDKYQLVHTKIPLKEIQKSQDPFKIVESKLPDNLKGMYE